ncbi:MAG: PEP-CTERM sorting domain-containing protein [Terrimicrobiaceae bacterium]|nr:PEP-CTERM sorting domain-containing protein [Terrimicrobiaceae bacterium]
MKKILAIIGLAAATLAGAQAQTLVYSNSGSLTGLITTVTAGDGGASISSGTVVLTNDASGTANASGRVYLNGATSSFLSPYTQVLNNAPGLVTWNFNTQQIRTDPSGFDGGNYGVAFVLGSTSSDITTGNGYAVVLGGSGSTDPVRLVSFTGGLELNSNLTDVISATSPLNDIGNSYMSIRVTFDTTTDTWTLLGRDDGASSFTDPTTGTLSSLGSANNSTFVASTLTSFGMLWNYSTTASQTAQFDNISIAVVPEPQTWVLMGIGGAFMLWNLRRRRGLQG